MLWDGGAPIGESSCVSCGHCVTVCPCNALMEKSMLGEAGYFTSLPKTALDGHDRRGQGHRAGNGLRRDSASFLKWKRRCAKSRIKRTKTVCTYCGVGCSFDIWTKDRHILKVEPRARPRQRRFDLRQRQVRLGLRQQSRPPDQAAHSRRRQISRGHLGRGARSGGAQIYRDQGSDTAPTRWPSSLPRSAPTKKAI